MSINDVLILVRPRQWTKNLAVFAALIFSGELTDLTALARTILAFGALCLVSAAVYAVNDAVDAERDREHPVKRQRPVAAGRMSKGQAYAIAVVLLAAGLGISGFLGRQFLLGVLLFIGIQIAYTLWLKNVLILDMLAIAAGFVVRAVAGAWVIDVPVSPWLVVCTGLLALFLAAAKRRHELLLLREGSGRHRPVLAEYSGELLDSFMVTLSAATITSYALYTFFERRGPGYAMMLTIPFVIYGVLRYQYLALNRDVTGRPEEVLLSDRPTLLTVLLWAATAVAIIYAF